MTIRPDPTFHATAKLAMEAPPEKYAYTLMLSGDFSTGDTRVR
jgi:selenium-binding protein 1